METFCRPERKIRIWMPEFHRMMMRLLNSSVRGSSRNFGRPAKIAAREPSFIIGTEATPWAVSMFITGPVAMITGRKKIMRKMPRARILLLSSSAMISEKLMMMGSCSTRLMAKEPRVMGKFTSVVKTLM